MLRLKRLKVRNFTTLKNIDIEFPEYGVVVVTGKNLSGQSSGMVDSIASGKTSIGEAIAVCLGIPGRFTYFSDYSRTGKDMYIEVQAEFAGKPLVIKNGYRVPDLSKTGESLEFEYDGHTVKRGNISDTREELQRLLNIDPEVGKWTTFINGDALKINSISQEKLVQLVMTCLNQPPWTDFYEKAKEARLRFSTKLGMSRDAIETYKVRLKSRKEKLDQAIENISSEESNLEEFIESNSGTVKKLEKYTTKKSEIEKIIEDLNKDYVSEVEKHSKTIAKDKNEQLQLQDEISELKQTAQEKFKEIHSVAADLRQLDSSREEMLEEPDTCPKCGKPWDKKHSKTELDKINKKVKDLEKKSDELNEQKKQWIKENISPKETKLEEMRSKKRPPVEMSKDLKQAHNELNDIVYNIKSLKRQVEDFEEDKSEKMKSIERLKGGLQELKLSIKETEEEILEKAPEIARSEHLTAAYDYIVKSFSPTGIPNYVLSKTVAPLNETATRVSQTFSGGLISIGFSTKRELASGKEKAELNVNISNPSGSKKIAGASKGESGMINLIMSECLSEVGGTTSRIGFKWYDEVLSNQDATVRKNILSYAREMAHAKKILVFIVDHHPEACNYADYHLHAVKSANFETEVSFV